MIWVVEMDDLGGFGIKTTLQESLPVWISKPEVRPVRLDGGDGGHMAPSQSLQCGVEIS